MRRLKSLGIILLAIAVASGVSSVYRHAAAAGAVNAIGNEAFRPSGLPAGTVASREGVRITGAGDSRAPYLPAGMISSGVVLSASDGSGSVHVNANALATAGSSRSTFVRGPPVTL